MTSEHQMTDRAGASAIRHLRQRNLADRWDLSVRTLERWRAEGRGPPFLKLGGRVCYRLSDIVEYEEAQRQTGDHLIAAGGGE